MTHNIAIILAAGSSRRMGNSPQDKVLLDIAGRSVISYSIQAFQRAASITSICIVTRDQDQKSRIQHSLGPKAPEDCPIQFCQGGSRRQDSVYNALLTLDPSATDIVVIHDAARPLITAPSIEALVQAAEESGAASLAHKAIDSIAQMTPNGLQALNRNDIWLMETPQAFQYRTILQAHQKARNCGKTLTDDSAAMELINQRVTLVETFQPNIKITHPKNLALAKHYLNDARHTPDA